MRNLEDKVYRDHKYELDFIARNLKEYLKEILSPKEYRSIKSVEIRPIIKFNKKQ